MTGITVGFNEAMALDEVLNANNDVFPFYAFHLFTAGRDRRFGDPGSHEIFFKSGSYNPATDSVTLVPVSATKLNQPLLFVINSPSVVFDLALNQLDGADNGVPGSPYVHAFGTRAAAPKVSARAFDAVASSSAHVHSLSVTPIKAAKHR